MKTPDQELLEKILNDEIHGRLINWGRWLRDDPGSVRGYPTRAPFVFSPRRDGMIADLDAEHIEWVVSSFNVSGIPMGELYAFILRIEYAERRDQEMPAQSQRAADVRKRFKRPCAERTYRHHLQKAKSAVRLWSGKIK